MNSLEAQRVIESLRKGIPPDGYVSEFTVGRASEVDQLASRLHAERPGALLIQANYGSGKTHLLRLLRETALREGFAVSYISLDSKSAVRFDKMDRILGTIIRNLECAGHPGKGPATLFSAVLAALTAKCPDVERRSQLGELSNHGSWEYTKTLQSQPLYVGLRAWIVATSHSEDSALSLIPQEVEAWLCEPWNYYTQGTWLLREFVSSLRRYFRDTRLDWRFGGNSGHMFALNRSEYQPVWDTLNDLNLLAQLAGKRRLIVLVDEFEDVIYNLPGQGARMKAFYNLFRLFDGDFQGHSFYAVTPGFVDKAKRALMGRGVLGYDASIFDAMPTFALSPLTEAELASLALRIALAHGLAYSWSPTVALGPGGLSTVVRHTSHLQLEDRSRHVIRELVKAMDERLEEAE